MSFLEIAKKRYSCRNYSAKKVESEKLDKILQAAVVAPTGVNKQGQKILVIQSDEAMEKLKKGAKTFNAPMALMICYNKAEAWKRPYDGKNISDIDASIVTDHMMLQATELGLNSLWMCYFKPHILREEFNVPKEYEIVNLLLLGYSDEEPLSPDRHTKLRKPVEEIAEYL